MDLNFTDIRSSFVNMVQQERQNEEMPLTDDNSSERQIFAEKFNKTLEKSTRPVNDTTRVAVKNEAPIEQDQEKIISFLSDRLNESTGVEFVSSLKTIFLMLSKGDLKNISIGAEGLEALKKILLKAGFKETDVNELIAELEIKFEENMDNGKLVLNDFMDKLLDLSLENKVENETDFENFIESSALPFIESILVSMAIPQDHVQEIIKAVDKGDQGISLDVLVEKLQQLQKKSFYTHQEYKTPEGNDNINQLIKQLNLETEKSNQSVLTFHDFVSAVERLRDKVSSVTTAKDTVPSIAIAKDTVPSIAIAKDTVPSIAIAKDTVSSISTASNSLLSNDQNNNTQKNENSTDLLKVMFKGIEIKEEIPEKQILEVSKSQLLNPTDLPIDAEKIVSHLFDDKQTKNPKNEILKSGIGKDITNLDKSIQPSTINAVLKGVVKEEIVEDKLNFKQTKSKIPTSELSQGTISETKSGEPITNSNLLKSKASFKNLPTYVTNQVGKSIVRAANQGENVLKIHLKPPELGRLMMTIDNSGNSMKVSIMTENHAAKDILASNVNELRTVLSNSGVNLEKFDVDMNSNFRQSMADARSQSGQSGKKNRNKDKLLSDEVNSERANESENLTNVRGMGESLHFVA